MKLNCVNVGYGDAFLFQLDKVNILIDTGSGLESEYEGYEERINIVKFLVKEKISHIDELILTHIHEDHVGNLDSIIKSFSISRVWIPKDFEKVKKEVMKDIVSVSFRSLILFNPPPIKPLFYHILFYHFRENSKNLYISLP